MVTRVPRTVMVAEDSAELRWLLREWLEMSGYTMHEAANPAAVLALAASADLIIMPARSRKFDGPALCDELRAAGHDVPVILTETDDRRASQLHDEGRFVVIVKPFDPHELERCVGIVLGVRAANHAPLK